MSMPTMNVSLPETLASFVERQVASGEYASQSEVVRDALRLLHREKAAEQEKLEMLRRAVMVGFDDWREGRLDDRSIDDILDRIDGSGDAGLSCHRRSEAGLQGGAEGNAGAVRAPPSAKAISA
jgi:antitoxin ParD1/3/4